MKKITIIATMMLMVSSSVFAADTVTMNLTDKTTTGLSLYAADATATASSSTALIGKTSTGVGLSMATGENGYALATQHLNGSKEFASSFDSTSIYAKEVATIGDVELDVTASDTSEFSGWKPL